MKLFKFLYLLFFCFSSIAVNAQVQNNDTIKTTKHSPKLATILSAVVPGSGQVYNKKYWKPPIIYIAGGVTVYLAVDYHNNYKRFQNAYNAMTDDDPNTVDEFNGQVPLDDVKYWRDKYRKYMEMNIIATAGIYILNIVDAAVDANFYDYDISDDLSIKIMPDYQYNSFAKSTSQNTFGIKIKLKF